MNDSPNQDDHDDAYDPDALEDELPDPIIDAMMNAGTDLQRRETWIAPFSSMAVLAVPRIVSSIIASASITTGGPQRKMAARRICLRILAYTPASFRIASIMRVARINPAAIDNLMLGAIPEEDQILRFNLMVSIGVFARHSLIEEVMSIERMDRVSSSIATIRNAREHKNTADVMLSKKTVKHEE